MTYFNPNATSLNSPPLERAFLVNDVLGFERLLREGADAGGARGDDTKPSLLHLLAFANATAFINAVLPYRPPLEANVVGNSPLHIVASHSMSTLILVKFVATYGLDGARNAVGETFLHCLMRNRLIPPQQIVSFLEWLSARFSREQLTLVVNLRNTHGHTLMDVACQRSPCSDALIDALMQLDVVGGGVLLANGCNELETNESLSRSLLNTLEDEEYTALLHIHTTLLHRWKKFRYCEARRREKVTLSEAFQHSCLALRGCQLKYFYDSGQVEEMQIREFLSLQLCERLERGRLQLTDAEAKHRDHICRSGLVELLYHSRRELQRCCLAQLEALRGRCIATVPVYPEPVTISRVPVTFLVSSTLDSSGVVSIAGADIHHTPTTISPADVPFPVVVMTVDPVDVCFSEESLLSEFVESSMLMVAVKDTCPVRADTRDDRSTECVDPQYRCHIDKDETLLRSPIDIIESFALAKLISTQLSRKRSAALLIEKAWCRHRQQQIACAAAVAGQCHAIKEPSAPPTPEMGDLQKNYENRIRSTKATMTKLLWRENFCCEMKRLLFLAHRRASPAAPQETLIRRVIRVQRFAMKYVLLAQFLLSCIELIYMAALPRTSARDVHNSIDIGIICLELLLSVSLPPSILSGIDVFVALLALVCAAGKWYGGAVAITLYTLKLPFVVRAFKKSHPGTNTFCRAIENVAFFLTILSPILFATVGGIIRYSCHNHMLLTSSGNVGSVFLYLWSSAAARVSGVGILPMSEQDTATLPSALVNMRSTRHFYRVGDKEIVTMMEPIASIIVFRCGLTFILWVGVFIGTHCAIKTHYDISDKTKLKRNKKRFREEAEPLDAHRVANIEHLGSEVDGAVMEHDVQSAKVAVIANYAKRTAGPPLKRSAPPSRQSMIGNRAMTEAGSNYTGGVCDCRQEDVRNAGFCDMKAIEIALGKIDQKGSLQRFVERQLNGKFYRRESTYMILLMLLFAVVFPNVYFMECAFGVTLFAELAVTLYVLDIDEICSNMIPILLRAVSCLISFIPPVVPFVAFRSIRLLEGWGVAFEIPGLILWDMCYAVVAFITMWMIAFASALQRRDSAGDRETFCNSSGECALFTLRDLALSAWTVEHVRTGVEGPLCITMIIAWQLVGVPFFLTFALHPLQRLFNFLGRFLRLVIRSLRSDLAGYLQHYFEGEEFYNHWRYYEQLPVRSIVKVKLWAASCRAPHRVDTRTMSRHSLTSVSDQVHVADGPLTEAISCSRFLQLSDCDPPTKWRNATVRMFFYLRRSTWFLYGSTALTGLSLVFLFVTTPWGLSSTGLVAVTAVIHVSSLITELICIPLEWSALALVASSGCLLFSTVVLIFNFAVEMYGLRFVSLIRVTQLNVYPFTAMRFFLKPFLFSQLSILFPSIVLVVGVCLIELPKSQVFLVVHRYSFSSVSAAELTRPQQLARHPWEHSSFPNTKDVRDLFGYYVSDNSLIFYMLLDQWVMPATYICTTLAYLYWSGANFKDSNSLLVQLIPLMENPINAAQYITHSTLWWWLGGASLISNLVFNCLFSPFSSMSHAMSFYFSCEMAFLFIGVACSTQALRVSLHRCGRCWDNLNYQRQSFSMAVALSEVVIMVSVTVELLYYCFVLPLSLALLCDAAACAVTPSAYATYLVPARFIFLLKLVPKPLIMSYFQSYAVLGFGVVSVGLYCVGATSTLADMTVHRSDVSFNAKLWFRVFRSFLRSTFSCAAPLVNVRTWEPFNATKAYDLMVSSNRTAADSTDDFSISLLMLLLSVFAKLLIAAYAGFFVAFLLPAWSTFFGSQLPRKSQRLYWALRGGPARIVRYSRRYNDDINPDTRDAVQLSKFQRMFTSRGIPLWAVPHLLEELRICWPSRQRRFMFALEQLFCYIPIAEAREQCVAEFVMQLNTQRCGASNLTFSSLPAFPAPEGHQVPVASEVGSLSYHRYIHPLRLIQAIALFELSFPADSTVSTFHWIEFMAITQKIRAATLLQSLWRMHKEEVAFDETHSAADQYAVLRLRAKFKRMRLESSSTFRAHSSFSEALRFDSGAFNAGSGHTEVLNRLKNYTFHDLNCVEKG